MMDASRLDWTLLRSFLAVVEEGSIVRAARRLGTYQPTLSRHIDALETQLGVDLFERTGRGLAPTRAALTIVDDVRAMSESVDLACAKISGSPEQPGGKVRVAASQVLACHVLPEILVGLRRRSPTIDVELVVSNGISNLLRREADVALRLVAPAQSSLIARRVGSLSIGIYAARSYLKGLGRPRTLAALKSHELIGLDTDPSLIRHLADAGLQLEREAFGFRSDDQTAGISLIAAGGGIGFLPDCVARRIPVLERLLPRMPSAVLPVWLVVHREIRGDVWIRAAYDYLAHELPSVLQSKPLPNQRAGKSP